MSTWSYPASSKQEVAVNRTLRLITAIGFCLATLALPARAQAPLQIYPDQSVGVLSEDPISGERWSTSVFPFGNYVGPISRDDVFCRTYLRFPFDAIPASATIQSATLYVYVDDFWPELGSAPMATYPVTAAWTPDGVDWYDMGAWPALGGAVATTDVSSDGGWFTWDVTGLVQGWVDGTPNYGLAVASAYLGSAESNWAAARRLTAGDPATRPYLEVTFLEPTPTPTCTPKPPPPPPPTATPQPPAPPATPVPTPTPEPILLPVSGLPPAPAHLWPPLVGLALLVTGLLLFRHRR
ncbi:MAG: DNRLRE domain-containing protein [Dehalococcoidia bacterium]|nr:MAG: DNRLRE domain-containing protein [Dehalococcoidia bacterium]